MAERMRRDKALDPLRQTLEDKRNQVLSQVRGGQRINSRPAEPKTASAAEKIAKTEFKPKSTRRGRHGWAIAAGIGLALVLGAKFLPFDLPDFDWPAPGEATAPTAGPLESDEGVKARADANSPSSEEGQ